MKIGLLADIHEDLPGLKKALHLFEKKGCDEILCLGDICGYSHPHFHFQKQRNASECIKLVRENCSHIITGNHDLHAIRKIPSSNQAFKYPDNWYDLDFPLRKAKARNEIWLYEDTELEANLSVEDKHFINTLPESEIIVIGRMRILLSHHLYPDLSGSSTRLLPDKELAKSHLEFMKDNKVELSFFGHNHVEGLWVVKGNTQRIQKRLDINENKRPTSIGVPCIARGKNKPGIAILNTISSVIESFLLYPISRRGLNF